MLYAYVSQLEYLYTLIKFHVMKRRFHMAKTEAKLPDSWVAYIEPFAKAIGSDAAKATEALKALVGEAGDDAISALQNEAYSPFAEIQKIFSDVPVAKLRKAVAENLRQIVEASPEVTTNAMAVNFDILPNVPDDASWLTALKTGGELKVEQPQVISAVRSALATRSGLFDIPKSLVTMMESHAESLDDPVGNEFFKLRKLLTKRSYAEVFEALDVEGSFVTESRKKAFIKKLDDKMWPEVASFHRQLRGWQDTWQQGASNPGMMMAAMAAMQTGGALPPGMMAAPETDTIRDAADSFNDTLNRVFAGTGIVVSMALAYEAQTVKAALENSALPAQVGAANREQMLKKLGANVSADYVRLETNITKYILGIMGLSKVPSGNEETSYLGALLMLGNSIPWDKIGSEPGRRQPRITEDMLEPRR